MDDKRKRRIARIREGATVMQDHAFWKWPHLSRTEEADIIFDCTPHGNGWKCVAPGFGVLGKGGDVYGNGAVFVCQRTGLRK